MLKLNIGDIPSVTEFTVPRPRQPSWQKAESEQTEDYTANLQDRMSTLQPPDSIHCQDPHCQNQDHRSERNSFMLDLICNMIEASHETIPMTGGSKHTKNGEVKCEITKCVPGWKSEVEPYRQDSLFWHSIWISSGRPNTGALHDVMY